MVYTRRSKGKVKSFASVVATPNQEDRLLAMEAQIQALIEENLQLKARLRKVEEAQAVGNASIHTGVKEVQTIKTMLETQKENQEATNAKIDKKVDAAMQEKKLQDALSLKVRIGGLPSLWPEDASLEDAITKLNTFLEPIKIKPETLSWLADRGKLPEGQCILTFIDREDRVRLLQQSHLLKGKKVWIAEELTTNQLKAKASELKKVHEARKQGKWAVYRGGRAIIQEFRTPRPIPSS